MKFASMFAGLALLSATGLALAACDRSDPPVKKLERAAEDTITEIEGETLPKRAKGPLAPRDECTDQPGGGEFLSQLRRAASTRDAEALAALSAEDVQLTFGGDSGRETLVRFMGENDGALWEELDTVLTMGCASDGATMTMPWYFAQDGGYDDAFTAMVVTGEDVALLERPIENAPQLGAVSWDYVELVQDAPEIEGYRRVTWTDPATDRPLEGYITQGSLRSVVDYRLMAARRNDRWRLVTFIAGD